MGELDADGRCPRCTAAPTEWCPGCLAVFTDGADYYSWDADYYSWDEDKPPHTHCQQRRPPGARRRAAPAPGRRPRTGGQAPAAPGSRFANSTAAFFTSSAVHSRAAART